MATPCQHNPIEGRALRIRAVEPADIDAIYAIALRTGASGQDATHLLPRRQGKGRSGLRCGSRKANSRAWKLY
jgi:hypothetical protein